MTVLEKQQVRKSAVLNVKAVLTLYKKYLFLLVLYASLMVTLFAAVLKVHILLSYGNVVYSVSFSVPAFCFLKTSIWTVNAFCKILNEFFVGRLFLLTLNRKQTNNIWQRGITAIDSLIQC